MRIWVLLAVAVVFLPSSNAADPAGTVKVVRGGAQVKRGSDLMDAKEGMHLAARDTLLTAADGSIGVILQDGTRISLGPNTELSIEDYVFDPGRGNLNLLLNMARGVLTYVSGKIAELSPGAVRLQTPVGIVGMRGTHFGVRLE
jgi:hypothetical protein